MAEEEKAGQQGSERSAADRLRAALGRLVRTERQTAREGLAELLGTFLLVALGDASVAQALLSKGSHGTFLSINVGWGVAVMVGVMVSGGVSGGHLNPAVSLAHCLIGNISLLQFAIFVCAQMVGAVAGSGAVYAVYWEALNAFDNGTRRVGGHLATAGIFATYPREYLSAGYGLADGVVSTSILVMVVLSVTDTEGPGSTTLTVALSPLLVGLTVTGLGVSFGLNSGYALNPARDLGPRLFTAFAGWGAGAFTHRRLNWFWVPLVGPSLGAVLGTGLYYAFVGCHWPAPTPPAPSPTPATPASKPSFSNLSPHPNLL